MSRFLLETEKYRFEFIQEQITVLIKIKLTEELAQTRDVTDEDVEEIKKFFEDIGKWETLLKTGINFLSDLEIIQVSEETQRYYQKEFSPEKYRIEVNKLSYWLIKARVHLSGEERHRRSGGEPQLLVDEVYKQVKNIPKWKSFIKTSQLLRQAQTQK